MRLQEKFPPEFAEALLAQYAARLLQVEEDDRIDSGPIDPEAAEERAAAAEALGAAVPGWLRENRLDGALAEVERILAGTGVPCRPDSFACRALARDLLWRLPDLLGRAAEEHRGRRAAAGTTPTPSATTDVPAAPAGFAAGLRTGRTAGTPPGPGAPSGTPTPTPAARLSEVRPRFLAAKKDDGLEPKTIAMMDFALRAFEAEVGDLPMASIGTDHVRAYRRALSSLPRDWAKKSARSGASVQDRLEAAKAEVASAPASASRALHPKSVAKNLGFVSSAFTWAIRERVPGVVRNPCEGMASARAERRRERTAASEERHAFTIGDLAAIFGSPTWSAAASPAACGAEYWLPVLAAYGGARLEELAGAELGDLKRHANGPESFWAIHLRPNGARRLKSPAATRVVPLHPTVLRLGFLEYAQRLKRAGAERLFPDLALGADGRFGSAYSKRFGRLLDRCGLTDGRLVFHSFRHSFATLMRNVSRNPDLVDRLMGHAKLGGSETDKRYMKQVFPAVAYEEVKRLNYGLRVFGEDPSDVAHLISEPVAFVEDRDA